MTSETALRRLVREKIAGNLLPPDECSKVLGGPADGETCDACSLIIAKTELLLECIGDRYLRSHLFHVRCFYIWDSEIRTSGGGPGTGPVYDVTHMTRGRRRRDRTSDLGLIRAKVRQAVQ